MSIVIGTNNLQYRSYRKAFKSGGHNGAYYYAKEIEKFFIPTIKTERHWDTLGMRLTNHLNHSIIFLHHNKDWDKTYKWLERYNDVILVVSSKATYEWAKSKGYKVIFLPLSIDVEYVKRFATEKTKGSCYAGNRWKFKEADIAKYVPSTVDFPPKDLPRKELLKFMAPYKTCYAIGRCALEARALGCRIRKCDSRYDPKDFKLLDSREAAKILQHELDKIDFPEVI